MVLEPKDLYQKLEFDKILLMVAEYCLGEPARERVPEIPILTGLEEIQLLLEEVELYKLATENSEAIPMSAYETLTEDLKLLAVSGYVLSIEGLQRVNRTMRIVQDLKRFFVGERRERYMQLAAITEPIELDPNLIKAIDQVIDEEGQIRSDASSELMRIRRMISGKQGQLDKAFRSVIQQYRSNGWLADTVESFRNGRRVLAVLAEHKRKIRGIIHDESATGRTAFIEPDPVIQINNDIFDLEKAEQREIYRLLKELSAALHPYVDSLREAEEVIIRMDLIRAKSQLALQLNAVRPKLKPKAHLGLKKAYHPLLYYKNKGLEKVTVPFDLTLFGPNRILVLSGPNAGGKSVTMKTVGLLQLMLQSGMLVTMHEDSEVGIYKKIFADIGDQQSLEDDLSTYSSRLRNMRIFLDGADNESLILIDEFGSGTDPKIGGAIAESLLREFNRRKVYGVITTHYSNLKIYAFQNKGIVNGAMTFDKETLSPSYHMKIGRPGSSFAYEVAEKSGLPGKILDYARKRTGKNTQGVEQLLVDLQQEKKVLEERLEEMEVREKKLERLIKNYQGLQRELDYRRKKHKLDVKESNLQKVAMENKTLEKLVRELREEKNLEEAKRLAAEAKERRAQEEQEVEALKDEVYQAPMASGKKPKQIEVGDYVRLRSGGASGRVERIDRKKVTVQMGLMKMTADIRDLVQANAPIETNPNKSIQTETLSNPAKFESKIDLRGLRKEEALKLLEAFMDKALLSSVTHVNILHGKGNGILRKAVKQKLKEYGKSLDKVYHPEEEQGGNGITMVEMAD